MLFITNRLESLLTSDRHPALYCYILTNIFSRRFAPVMRNIVYQILGTQK